MALLFSILIACCCIDRGAVPETVLVERRGRWRRRLVGLGLIGYGLIGIALFVAVALAIARPLERAQRLSSSVESQRAALTVTLDETSSTIRQMSDAVGRMDFSLSEAKAATDRGSSIASGVATSMFQLRDAMSLSIFGAQPLISLAVGFDNSAHQLQLLGDNMTAIGLALEGNRADVLTTSTNLRLLAESVGQLSTAVADSPSVEISTATLNVVRLAIYAVAGWMVLLAVGCVIAGLYLIGSGRGRHPT